MIARKELEVSIGWAKSYPTIYVKTLRKWKGECTALGMTFLPPNLSRKGFVTYLAQR
jgi:hypothetical protein